MTTETTVREYATTIRVPVEHLLEQMKEAGLPHTTASELISEDDKKALMAHVKPKSEAGDAPKKITLQRKRQTTLKTNASQGKRTVSVEVRKKRTIVSDKSSQDLAAEAKLLAEQKAAEEAAKQRQQDEQLKADQEAQAKALQEEQERLAKEAEEKAAKEAELAAQRAKEEREALERSAERDPTDPEVLRQLAALRRQEKERLEAEEHAALMRAKNEAEEKAKAEAEAKRAEEKAAKNAAKAKAEKNEEAKPAEKTVGKRKSHASDDDDGKEKAGKGRGGKDLRRGKKRNAHAFDDDLGDAPEAGGKLRRNKKKLKRSELKQQAFEKPTEKMIYEVELAETITVGDLAQKMYVKAGEVIKALMGMGVMATLNQALDQDTAILIIEELGHSYKLISETELEDNLFDVLNMQEGTLEARPPVVTVMGHVDHGKTSLLDYIRKSRVASGEAGGITQHIGAYHVKTSRGIVTFLDTPGHAAFTAMRARGAQSTDVVILVVAADDGVMPQTKEAIQHSRAAGVPIVVAITKVDKPEKDLDRVRNELVAEGVVPEDWGGDIQFIGVSSKTGEGIDELLEAVALQAEMLELQAAKDIPARGVVVESRLDKGRGTVATVLVQTGTLRRGDIVLAGEHFGRIRAMVNEGGKEIKEAGPSIPAEILGLGGTPEAGDEFFVVNSEKQAREVAEFRNQRARETRLARQQASKLENLFESMGQADSKQELNVVLKSDVRGSLEAIQSSLLELGNEEVAVNIVSAGVGGISDSDVNLAITTNAVIFGFNVRAENTAKQLCEQEGIELRYYSVIYTMIEDVKQALSGMLSPEMREQIVGIAEVRDTFKSPKFGLVAGCMVTEGTVYRNKPIRVLRDNVVIFEGELESLRRFKDDVAEVRHGMECGIGVKNYLDVKVGDLIEVFDRQEVARSL